MKVTYDDYWGDQEREARGKDFVRCCGAGVISLALLITVLTSMMLAGCALPLPPHPDPNTQTAVPGTAAFLNKAVKPRTRPPMMLVSQADLSARMNPDVWTIRRDYRIVNACTDDTDQFTSVCDLGRVEMSRHCVVKLQDMTLRVTLCETVNRDHTPPSRS